MRGRLDGLRYLTLFLAVVFTVFTARAEDRNTPIPLSKTVEKPAKETKKEASLRLFLFQKLVNENQRSGVIFVDYANQKNLYPNGNVTLVEPPAELIKTLSANGKDVRPVSAALIIPAMGQITASKNGERNAVVLNVWIKRWVDADTAEVEYMEYCGFLAASGAAGIARFKDGKWTFEEKSGWLS